MRPKKEPEGMKVFFVAAAVHRTSVPPSKHSGKGVNGDGGGAGGDSDRKVCCFSLLVHDIIVILSIYIIRYSSLSPIYTNVYQYLSIPIPSVTT